MQGCIESSQGLTFLGSPGKFWGYPIPMMRRILNAKSFEASSYMLISQIACHTSAHARHEKTYRGFAANKTRHAHAQTHPKKAPSQHKQLKQEPADGSRNRKKTKTCFRTKEPNKTSRNVGDTQKGKHLFSPKPCLLYWGCLGIMEKKMETTIVYWGYRGVILG